MIVTPDNRICIGNDEPMTLTASVDGASKVELRPRFADVVTYDLEDGAFTFPHMSVPEQVEIRWQDEEGNTLYTSYAEVVSRHYFPLQSIRTYGNGMDDFSELTDDQLYAARQAATETFEENAHRAFVQRLGRTKDYGRSELVELNHRDVDTVITQGYVQVSDCQLERDGSSVEPFPRWVDYIYGYDYPPTVISEAVLMLACYILRPSNRPLGATGESSDAGYIHFTTAGRDGATAIPEVNAVIEQFGAGLRYVM